MEQTFMTNVEVLRISTQQSPAGTAAMKPTDHYDHGQACKLEGIPYEAWCCAGCAERLSLDFIGRARSSAGGWCQVGKHNVKTESAYLEIDPDLVTPWPTKSAGYLEARKRYAAQSPVLQACIDAEYNSGEHTEARFVEAVAFVLDI